MSVGLFFWWGEGRRVSFWPGWSFGSVVDGEVLGLQAVEQTEQRRRLFELSVGVSVECEVVIDCG